jgi:hypothetical protein
MEPLPPVKEVEYRCYISKIFEELSGSEYMTFAFETAKEFSSFRYEIAVRYRILLEPPTDRRLEFKVLGMTATRTMMPAFGTARSVLKVPLLPLGVYTVKMIKSDGIENVFVIEVTKKGFQILQPIPRKRFIDLVIESKAAAPNARHTSTVSKAPTIPLVPRTIQKRQLPGEEDLLDPLDSDSNEDREELEEDELFGSEQPEKTNHSKAGAKHTIDEVKEIPATAKRNVESAPKQSKAPAKVAEHKPAKKVEHKPEKKAEHKPAKAAKKPAAKPKPAPKNHAPAKKAAPKKPIAKAKQKPAPKKNGKKK